MTSPMALSDGHGKGQAERSLYTRANLPPQLQGAMELANAPLPAHEIFHRG